VEDRAITKFAKAVPVMKDVRNAAFFFVTPVVGVFTGDVAIAAGARTVVAAMGQHLALTRRELI
jgi:hypothetical protein